MAPARRDHYAGLPQPPVQVTRVSVIIPCFNREALLGETLDSVRAQTFGDWEAIIVDDHSEDNSVQVARSYAQSDNRIRVVSRQGQRKGGNICRNEGLALARGDYVIFLDSDDLLSEECLEHRIAGMDNAPECGYGVFQTELFRQNIGDRGVLWNTFAEANDLHRFLSLDTVWITTGPIWRKDSIAQLGGFDEHSLNFQDWYLHVRALISGIKYFKNQKRDNFHRHDYAAGKTITDISNRQIDHLNSRAQVFAKTWRNLRDAGLFNDETRFRLAGAYWWLANLWQSETLQPGALKVWYTAARQGLCSWRNYLEGALILSLQSARRGAPVIRWLQRSWPPQFTQSGSKSLCSVPIEDGQRHAQKS
jgi:glycosyltransferase involved in cell wall biosynthesis